MSYFPDKNIFFLIKAPFFHIEYNTEPAKRNTEPAFRYKKPAFRNMGVFFNFLIFSFESDLIPYKILKIQNK